MHQHDTNKNLKIAIWLTATILVVEIAGGFLSGSLALLSDAAHMFNDAFALFLTWFTLKLSCKLTNETKTFGYHRTEILAALINSLLLLYVSYRIIKEAIHRVYSPTEIQTGLMMGVAIIGLAINLIILFKLKGHSDLNLKSAWLHVLGDTLSSVGVVVGAIIISVTGIKAIDPILSLIIAIVIITFAVKLLWESLNIFLEAVPKGISIDKLILEMKKIKGVNEVHSVHVWTICSHIHVMSAHVLTNEKDLCNVQDIIDKINNRLKRLDIEYTTLQFESKVCKVNRKIRDVKH